MNDDEYPCTNCESTVEECDNDGGCCDECYHEEDDDFADLDGDTY